MPFTCWSCGLVVTEPAPPARCPTCNGVVRYVERRSEALRAAVEGDVWAAMPDVGAPISMGEGDTPLVDVPVTAEHATDVARATDGGDRTTVLAKLESLNPTCSFKDRGSALTVSAVTDPATAYEALVVASTGNTATSVAAYAARAGVPCAVLVPEDVSLAKLGQAVAHGARVFTVDGTFSDCFTLAERVADEQILNATAVYSANPYVATGDRAVAFEIVERLGCAPDWVTVPVGAGPLLGGTYFGFEELAAEGIVEKTPRMACVQAEGCHPIARALEEGRPVQEWTEPIETSIGAIADPLRGYAADGEQTRRATEKSEGVAVTLPDDAVHAWAARLSREAGVYAEPASAAAVAAVEAAPTIDPSGAVVALVTGHGLKEGTDETPETTAIGRDEAPVRAALVR